jgi:hypothetical protein
MTRFRGHERVVVSRHQGRPCNAASTKRAETRRASLVMEAMKTQESACDASNDQVCSHSDCGSQPSGTLPLAPLHTH